MKADVDTSKNESFLQHCSEKVVNLQTLQIGINLSKRSTSQALLLKDKPFGKLSRASMNYCVRVQC